MTELERHLMNGFEKLAKQYEADMKRQQAQNLQLQEQALQLQNQISSLSQRVEQLTRLHQDSETQLRQDLNKTFSSLSAQLTQLAES
jgi:phage shock protein A